MADVRFVNLTKVYPPQGRQPAFKAVRSINLEIRDREFMVLVGPSGCGKSTTLRMLAGLEEITEGECWIGNRLVNNVLPKDRDIAMVFQNYALYPHMTVYENMAFGLKLQKKPKAEIDARVREAAEILGLQDLLQRKPRALSGGQRQRVAVGRAIVRKPRVFLFDEPLSNLDAKMRVQMRTEISKLHARLGATMIYVTHDQVEAMTMGDRICVMKDGEIMQVAEPLEIYHNPANMFVAGFIGSPPMNFVHGVVFVTGGRTFFRETGGDGDGFEIELTGELAARAHSRNEKPTVLGIRPENLYDARRSDPALPGPVIEARIDVSEPMGAETYLYLTTGRHNLVARVRSSERYDFGEPVKVRLDLENAHLFDPETEKVLG